MVWILCTQASAYSKTEAVKHMIYLIYTGYLCSAVIWCLILARSFSYSFSLKLTWNILQMLKFTTADDIKWSDLAMNIMPLCDKLCYIYNIYIKHKLETSLKTEASDWLILNSNLNRPIERPEFKHRPVPLAVSFPVHTYWFVLSAAQLHLLWEWKIIKMVRQQALSM